VTTHAPEPTTLPEPAKALRLGVLAVSALVGVSAVVGVAAATFAAGQPIATLIGFELVTLIAAVLGVLTGLGRFRVGWAMACLCVAGTIFGAAGLGFLDARANFQSHPDIARLIKPILAFRLASSAAIVGLGSLAVFARKPGESWPLVFRSIAFAAPIAVVGAIALVKPSILFDARTGVLEILRLVLVIGGGFVLMVLFSLSGHFMIKAFEAGREQQAP